MIQLSGGVYHRTQLLSGLCTGHSFHMELTIHNIVVWWSIPKDIVAEWAVHRTQFSDGAYHT